MIAFLPLLKLIAENKIPKEFLTELPQCVIVAVSELSYNRLYGEIPLSDEEQTNLK